MPEPTEPNPPVTPQVIPPEVLLARVEATLDELSAVIHAIRVSMQKLGPVPK